MLNIYNLAIAFDAAIITLSRACPFYEGRVAGKAMRTIHYRGSTEGIQNTAIRDYLDSILEFSCQDDSEVGHYLAQFKTTLGEYTTTEAQLLAKFPTTTGTISQADGLALVRYCCDRLEEEVSHLESGQAIKNVLTQ
ncbi:hypothetical protein C7B62_15255 [Pleurocapsa sp. CCALA 161]|uniref:hypothetical protein n=1 Tax=Pleurocapsa sp. CCALA 161 TaxID=2107688 RepID=UPI000D04CE96|nr:hypothetical protein [Pleurocapsa sp. CCALA 161]PSB08861.1 hypothetical protein C7B62_15255 [Pleurocapsa sp. CCALA 161]